MSFFSKVFGGSEQKSSSTPTKQSVLSKEQKDAIAFLEPLLEGSVGTPQTEVPGLTSLQATSLSGLEEFANTLLPGGSNTQPNALETSATNSLQNILGQGSSELNDILKQTVDDPLMEILNEQLLPGIRDKFAGNQNFFGGERIGAEFRATEDTVGQIGRQRAASTLDLFDRQISAANAAPGVSQITSGQTAQGINNLLQLLQGGEIERGVGLDQIDLESQRINQLLGLLGVNTNQIANRAESSGTTDKGIIPGLSSLGFSDRRLKRDIIYLGMYKNIPIYSFRYIFGKYRYVGTMAQEVMHLPNIVSRLFGFYRVDYKKLMGV